MPIVGNYITTENRRDIKLPIADVVTGTVAADGAIPSVATIAALRAGSGGSADGQVIYVKGFAASGDGGEGHFVWNAASTATDNTGTVIKATPATGRWLRQTDGGMYNIKWFGAKGDGNTDDAAAIRTAIKTGHAIFFPTGTYVIQSAIAYDYADKIVFIGESAVNTPNVTIVDHRSQTSEPMFHPIDAWVRPDGVYDDGHGGVRTEYLPNWHKPIHLENISLYANIHPNSSCMDVMMTAGNFFKNCWFYAAGRGLTLAEEANDTTVIGCTFSNFFFPARGGDGIELTDAVRADAELSWGISCHGHTRIISCTVVGCGTGIIILGAGCQVHGCRIERNYQGITVGGQMYWHGGHMNGAAGRMSVKGISMEANTNGLRVMGMSGGTIDSIGIQGDSSAAPGMGGKSETGVLIEFDATNRQCSISNIGAGGTFTRGAIINKSRTIISHSEAINSWSAPVMGAQHQPWSPALVPVNVKYCAINAQICPEASNDRHKSITAFHDLMLPGLTGLNLRDIAASGDAQGGHVFAKNLGGAETPSNGATYIDVAFRDNWGISQAPLESLTPTGSGSSLAAGEYWYALTGVAKHGESGIDPAWDNIVGYRHVTITAGQNISISMHGAMPSVFKRRLYRGRARGLFEGYWDNMGMSFIDDGTRAFDGKSSPPEYGFIPKTYEDDANYQIVATASWGTTVYVTNKATTGFTLNFGTAAPDANQTVAWLMFRP